MRRQRCAVRKSQATEPSCHRNPLRQLAPARITLSLRLLKFGPQLAIQRERPRARPTPANTGLCCAAPSLNGPEQVIAGAVSPGGGPSGPPDAAPTPVCSPVAHRPAPRPSTLQVMAGDDPPPTAPPVAEALPAVEAPAPATESLGAAPPAPDLEAAEAPPLPAQAPPATKGWRDRFGKKKSAGDDDPTAAVAPADAGSALPPSYPAEGGAELPGQRVQVPPRKWPTLSKYLWMGWDSRPWPPVAGAYAAEIPSGGAVAAAATPAAAAGAAGGAAAAGGAGASWFAWPDFGGLGGGQQEPEAWCKDYVKVSGSSR